MAEVKLSPEQTHSPELKELSIKQELEEFPFHVVTVKTEDDEDESFVLHQRPTEESRDETTGLDCEAEAGCSSDPLTRSHSDSEEHTGDWPLRWEPRTPPRADLDPDCPLVAAGGKRRPLTCSWCGKDFVRRSELQRHVLIHTGQKPFKCPFCAQCFRRKSNLKRHTRVHTGEKPFICPLCDKAFAYKQNLEKHSCGDSEEQTASPDEGRPHRCAECGKGFTRLSNLHIHRLVHTQERSQKCSICLKAFKQKASLTRHLKIHHHVYPSVKMRAVEESTEEAQQKCPDCGKEFSRKYDVKRHMRTHTGEKPFLCPVCGQGFAVKSNVKVHMATHSEEKCYRCPFCNKGFTQDSSMKRHMNVHN